MIGQSSLFIKDKIENFDFYDNYNEFFKYELIKYKYKDNFNDCCIGIKNEKNENI